MGFIDGLRELLFQGAPQDEPDATQVPIRPQRRTDQTLYALAAAAKESGAPIVAGVITLDPAQAGRNDRTVLDVLAQEIDRALQSTDAVIRTSSSNPIICFAHGDETTARRTLEEISQATDRRLQQADADLVAPEHRVVEVPADAITLDRSDWIGRFASTIADIASDLEQDVAQQRRALLRGGSTVFRPVWHVQSRRTEINRCVLEQALPHRLLAGFADLTDSSGEANARAAVDCVVLVGALEAAQEAVTAGQDVSILAQVALETVLNPILQHEYLTPLADLAYAPQLVVEVDATGEGSTPERLGIAVNKLRYAIERVTVLLSPQRETVSWLAQPGLWGASALLEQPSRAEAWRYGAGLRRFARDVGEAELVSIAHGANTIGLAKAAIDADFAYVDGAAIHLNAPAPRSNVRLNPSSLEVRNKRTGQDGPSHQGPFVRRGCGEAVFMGPGGRHAARMVAGARSRMSPSGE